MSLLTNPYSGANGTHTGAGSGEPAVVVDARGHRCPMPLLMAKRGLNRLQPGQTLTLLSTDPGSRRDFEIFSRQSGHRLLEATEDAGELRFILQKSA